jgi:two-component system cell cycle response regulator CpdR
VSDEGEPPATRVLVVDDEFAVRDFVSRTLRQAGYETETASDSGVALMIADAAGPFNLLVTDLKMPGMNGADLARALLQRFAHLKVLFFTAYAESLVEQDAKFASRQAVLGKPCRVAELLHAVSLIQFGHIRGPETGV